MKLVSVVILNWNGENYIKDCLDSLKKQKYKNYEIIVVDNNSTDNSIKLFKKYFPKIKLIKNKENLGYSGGNNMGIQNSKGEYIILLNMDTLVDKDWLGELVKVAESDKYIGTCQSKILLFDKKNKINTAGNAINFLGFGYCMDYLKDKNEVNNIREINFSSGASILIKREVINKIGLLDKDFFLYGEDLDFGWRVLLQGYKNLLAPNSIVYHKYNFSRNNLKMYYLERNRLTILLKNYELKTLILISPAFLFTEIGLLFYSVYKGFFTEKIKGYKDFFLTIKNTLTKRKKIQIERKIKDKEIIKLFSNEIKFEEIKNPFLDYIANPIIKKYYKLIR